jgi:hypothetical protein
MNFENPWVIGIGVGIILIVLGIIIDIIKIVVKKRIARKIKPEVLKLEERDLASDIVIHDSVPQEKKAQIIVLEQEDLAVSHYSRLLNLTPKAIVEAINKSPPLQKETVGQSYKGIKVKWKVIFRLGTVQKSDESDKYQLSMKPVGGEFYPWISCVVDANVYPQFKILEEGTEFEVEGEIKEASTFDIELENCTIFF